MYGKSVKCDKCGKIEMLPSFDGVFDAGFYGWIRMIVHAPKRWDYDTETSPNPRSETIDSVDLCSIWCARTYLTVLDDTTIAGDSL